MPDVANTTIAKYAVATSLAAVTLIYVFQPTFTIDVPSSSASTRKRGIVGLSNPANDCFINSVLQALAGLGDLRLYLIREVHRRKLDGEHVYKELAEEPSREKSAWKIEGQQRGLVTVGLKEILDALNERPIYRKTISAASFVRALEDAFKQRISRQQQDAQEFLQIVAERLSDEYLAGKRARAHADKKLVNGGSLPEGDEEATQDLKDDLSHTLPNGSKSESAPTNGTVLETQEKPPNEEGFPLQGNSESQLECHTCSFKPTPTPTAFTSLTLNVPQDVSSTTLNACFDTHFKTEVISDFKCEKCRLIYALDSYKAEYKVSTSERFKSRAELAIKKLEEAIATDPEKEDLIKDIEMPDSKHAPRRKINRHVRITTFPKILAIHLSRSIYDVATSLKNSAKVSFPERLRLGGLLDAKFYRLTSVVCHKGSHHSGHYESFRRQSMAQPFSTPNTFHTSGAYSKTPTPISTPQRQTELETSTLCSENPDLLSPSTQSTSSLPTTNGTSRASGESTNGTSKPVIPRSSDAETSSLRSIARSAKSTLSKVPSMRSLNSSSRNGARTNTNATFRSGSMSVATVNGSSRKKSRGDSRWWRISDDKVKECKTSDVLGMQREVYMLFYEMEKDEDGA